MPITRSDLERSRGKWSRDFQQLNPGEITPTARAGARQPGFTNKTGLPAPKSPLAVKFEELWARLDGPPLTPEHQFHPKRKWRFDYALPDYLVAIELEGGLHKRGKNSHTGATGYVKDCHKYNAAAADGWVIYRLATGMVVDGNVAPIRAAIVRRVKIMQMAQHFC